jgi:23S rRNA (adenine2503-C2)-methyltransferase
MGLERGLTAGEIVGQVLLATREVLAAHLPAIRNVVFMGMGEPLDNLDAVRTSIAVLCAPSGFALGPTHITLSTVGTTPAAILATRDLPVQLAWSLHAVDDTLRLRLVPTMRHSTEALRQAFLDRLSETGGSLFVEMTLMDGVNDALHHADELTLFLAPFSPSVRVNLLPMNAGREGLRASPEPRVVAFRQRLRDRGVFCAIRRPRGVEASAACGQLVISSAG